MANIYWFRYHDLRLHDNPALSAAVKSSEPLILIFILNSKPASRMLGGAQQWWLHHSLKALALHLKKHGAHLILRRGNAQTVLTELSKQHQLQAIYWNRSGEPHALQWEQQLIAYLQKQKIDTHTFNGSLLTEPAHVKNKSGDYFKVFTPYWRAITTSLNFAKPLNKPNTIKTASNISSEHLDDWNLLPKNPDWSTGFNQWQPGERGAQQALKQFINHALNNYAEHRDRPDLLGTSRLSPHLHFGEISPRQVWHTIKQIEIADPNAQKGASAFLRQLIWREFCYYLLFYFPQLKQKNFQAKFDRFRWNTNKKYLAAWQQGLTGYPIVDAGMRELWHTGYLHNRVRMIVASFLTKDLLIDWREGERWFWDTLLDADLANNAAGWQWVAGSGADAAPYFRIFNPILQSKKFDPNGDYIRKWIPELAQLPTPYIYEPSSTPAEILRTAEIQLGNTYPLPIIDHRVARTKALEQYQQIKS